MRSVRTLVVLAIVGVSSVARGGDAALAEQLFRDGKALMEQGKYEQACPKLAESQRNDPGSGTLVALGLCYEALGKTASAWSTFNEAVAAARQVGREDREKAAAEHAARLEPKLSRLTVTLKGTPANAIVVTRDGVELKSAVWGSAMPVDPGKHIVEAVAPGKQKWSTTIDVGPNADRQAVEVPQLENVPAPPAPVVHVAAPAPVFEKRGGGVRFAGYVIGGVGLAGVVAGSIFGGLAFSLHGEAEGLCNNVSPCSNGDAKSKNDDAGTAAGYSTAFFAVGLVAVAAGAVMVVVGGPHTIRVTPTLGGLVVAGSF